MSIMSAIRDIVVKAKPDGAAHAEANTTNGVTFMWAQFGRLDANLTNEDINDFFAELRKRDISFRFIHG